MHKEHCFVIQPFDSGGKFDQRFDNILKPAINLCGYHAYRADRDPSISVIINAIHDKIKNSRLCLADITNTNANVWYELGYAIAHGKEVVIIAQEGTKIPFDTNQRPVIYYKDDTSSTTLGQSIIEKIEGLNSTISNQNKNFNALPAIKQNSLITVTTDEYHLDNNEISVLKVLLEQSSYSDVIKQHDIHKPIYETYGYSEFDNNWAVVKLCNKQFIEKQEYYYHNSEYSYLGLKMTDIGKQWLIYNESKWKHIKDEIPF